MSSPISSSQSHSNKPTDTHTHTHTHTNNLTRFSFDCLESNFLPTKRRLEQLNCLRQRSRSRSEVIACALWSEVEQWRGTFCASAAADCVRCAQCEGERPRDCGLELRAGALIVMDHVKRRRRSKQRPSSGKSVNTNGKRAEARRLTLEWLIVSEKKTPANTRSRWARNGTAATGSRLSCRAFCVDEVVAVVVVVVVVVAVVM